MPAQEPDEGRSRSRGFFDPVRRALGTVVSTLQTRLELVVTELEEERERFKKTMLLVFVTLFSLSLGLVLLTVFIAALLREDGWIYALGILAALYLGAGLVAAVMLRTQNRHRPKPLSATLSELVKDRDHLRP